MKYPRKRMKYPGQRNENILGKEMKYPRKGLKYPGQRNEKIS
jgi:hypothetical protein